MLLIDKYFPEYHFSEFHSRRIAAEAENVFQATKDVRFDRSWMVRLLFTLRGINRLGLSLREMMATGFLRILEEDPNKEFVMGGMTSSFLMPIVARSTDDFVEFNPRSGLKLTWNFTLQPEPDGTILLATETRVRTFEWRFRVAFGLYWMVVRPFSGIVRREILRIIAEDCEGANSGLQ